MRSGNNSILKVGSIWLLAVCCLCMLPSKALAAETYVSLTFDDARASQVNAGAILANAGVHGTFYVNSSNVGSSSYNMSLTDLRELAASGNEIGGHTATHIDLATANWNALTYEICGEQQQLQSLGFPALSFSYPFGSLNAGTKAAIKNCPALGYTVSGNYSSARGVDGIACTGCSQAESIPPWDPFYLRTDGSLNGTTMTLAQLQNTVTQAEATGGWVIIPFHSVCSAPQGAPIPGNATDCTAGAYQISYSDLNEFVMWLNARSSLGTSIRTVSEVMQLKPNLVQNPSLEVDANSDQVPDGFWHAGYGVNEYKFTRVATGVHSGHYAEEVTISSFSDGDRKLLIDFNNSGSALPGTPGLSYMTSAWYKSSQEVMLAYYFHDVSGWHYWTHSPIAPASSTWTQVGWVTPPIPPNVDAWSFGPAILGAGTMTIDDLEAFETDGGAYVDMIAPVITDIAPTGSVGPGPTQLSANYSDAAIGVKAGSAAVFLDGNLVSGCLKTEVSVNCQIGDLAQGNHHFMIFVEDYRGNVSSAESSFLSTPGCSGTKPGMSINLSRAFWGSYSDYQVRRLSLEYSLTNNSADTVNQLTAVASTATNGVLLDSGIPLSLGTLGPGVETTLTATYLVPSMVNSFRTTTYFTAEDACGNQFSYPGPFAGS